MFGWFRRKLDDAIARRQAALSAEHARILADEGFISTRQLDATETLECCHWILKNCYRSIHGEPGVYLRTAVFDIIGMAQRSVDRNEHWVPGPLRLVISDRDDRMLFKLTWC